MTPTPPPHQTPRAAPSAPSGPPPAGARGADASGAVSDAPSAGVGGPSAAGGAADEVAGRVPWRDASGRSHGVWASDGVPVACTGADASGAVSDAPSAAEAPDGRVPDMAGLGAPVPAGGASGPTSGDVSGLAGLSRGPHGAPAVSVGDHAVAGTWAGRDGAGAVPAPSAARRVAAPLAALAGVATAFAYVGTVDPNEPGHYPVCPLLRFTGIYCPGCGGLRSANAFVHGDLGTALGANAAAVVGYAVFAVVWVLWLVRALQGRPLQIGLAPRWWWVMGGALLIFSVVRNLPFGSALAP